MSDDGLDHKPIKKIIDSVKAGKYKVYDKIIHYYGYHFIKVYVDVPEHNPEFDRSIIIESKNGRNLDDNTDRNFTSYRGESLEWGSLSCPGRFTEEEWNFILSIKLPYTVTRELKQVCFVLFKD